MLRISRICVFVAILLATLFVTSSCYAAPSGEDAISPVPVQKICSQTPPATAYLDVEKTVSYNVVQSKAGPIVYKKGINKFPDELTVKLVIGPKGRGISGHADIVLVIDDSGSMSWTDPDNIRVAAARRVVQNNFTYCDRGAVVIFASTADQTPRGSSAHHLNTMGHYGEPHSSAPQPGEGYGCLRDNDLNPANFYSSGSTNYLDSLNLANTELIRYGYDGITRTCPGCFGGHERAMIFLSDGTPNVPHSTAHEREVTRARQNGIKIFTIGLSMTPGSSPDRILYDMARLTNAVCFECTKPGATPVNYPYECSHRFVGSKGYVRASTPEDIDRAYGAIIGALRKDVVAQPAPSMNDIILQEALPKHIEFVPGSNSEMGDAHFLGVQYFADYTILEWALGGSDKKIKVGEPNILITYRIKALATKDAYGIPNYVTIELRNKNSPYGDPSAINNFNVYSVVAYKNITDGVNYTYPMLSNGYLAPATLPTHLSKDNKFINVIAPKPQIAPVPVILPPIGTATFGGGLAVLNPALMSVQISTLTSVVTGTLVGQAIVTTTPVVLSQALATSMVTSVALGSPLGLLAGLGVMERIRLKRKVRAMQIAVKPREELPKIIGE